MAQIEILKKEEAEPETYIGKLVYEDGYIIAKDNGTEFCRYPVDKVVHATAE